MSSGEPAAFGMRSYGRTRTRTLKPGRQALMAERLPGVALSLTDETLLDLAGLCGGASEVWLEIGFGGGEHMTGQAQRRPDVLILGAEPFENGVASAIGQLADLQLTNIRLHKGDARELMAKLPDSSLERIFMLFPDPWPKARHRKRRLLNAAMLVEIRRLLKPGGRFRFATDWADYAEETLRAALAGGGLEWTALSDRDWRRPPPDHLTTRYERKGLGDMAPLFLDFVRP